MLKRKYSIFHYKAPNRQKQVDSAPLLVGLPTGLLEAAPPIHNTSKKKGASALKRQAYHSSKRPGDGPGVRKSRGQASLHVSKPGSIFPCPASRVTGGACAHVARGEQLLPRVRTAALVPNRAPRASISLPSASVHQHPRKRRLEGGGQATSEFPPLECEGQSSRRRPPAFPPHLRVQEHRVPVHRHGVGAAVGPAAAAAV